MKRNNKVWKRKFLFVPLMLILIFLIKNFNNCLIYFSSITIGTLLLFSIANFGAVIISTPSEDRFDITVSALHPCGKVYFLAKYRETCLLPSSDFSSCSASTVRTLLAPTSILISSGR